MEGGSFNGISVGIVLLGRSFGWNSNTKAIRLSGWFQFQLWGFERVCAKKRSRERKRHFSEFGASESEMNQ